jgi:hypothetical protein
MKDYCYVDQNIGTWCVAQDECNGKKPRLCIAIIKDVDQFCEAVDLVEEKIHEQKPLNDLYELVKFIEFAEVKISKSGIVKWHSGQFVKNS